MLNLFDYLTEKDNKIIENYMTTFGVEEGYIGNSTWLQYWKDNKKKLFKLLDGQLIYTVPFEYDMSTADLRGELERRLRFHNFISEFKECLRQLRKDEESILNLNTYYYDLLTLCDISNFIDDEVGINLKLTRTNTENNKKITLQIMSNMKPIKAIQKVLNYFDELKNNEKLMTLFEDFKKQHSIATNSKHVKCNICISIHPMDFMTMSDNANHWTSCMSWSESGCYHAGTVEMMNSNNVVCAYLDSSIPYVFNNNHEGESDEFYTWNNKKWRQLFYCTKEIIVSGKSYPYASEQFTCKVLEILRELAKKNWNQEYEYGIEPYKDMTHITSYWRMIRNFNWIEAGNTKKHNIIFHSRGMYNDMLNDNNTKYYCIRNKVKKNTIITYSGFAPCVCCGQDVLEENQYYDVHEDGAYNDRFNNCGNVICCDCRHGRECSICGNENGLYSVKKFHGVKYCSKCWDKHIRICPDCGKVFTIDPSWGENNIRAVYMLHVSADKALSTYDYASSSCKDTDVSTRYYACKSCIDKILKSKDIMDLELDDYRYWESNIRKVFTKTFDKQDPFVLKHSFEQLGHVPFKDTQG